MSDDPLQIPDFLRRSNKENKMAKPEPKAEAENKAEAATDTVKEARPSRDAFNTAANRIDEIDAEIDKVYATVEDKIKALNDERNAASEVVRKYLGRKR